MDPITLDEQITLAESLERTAKKVPHKPALVWKKEKITYASLLEKVRRVGKGLFDLGVGSKDRVALLLPNCPEYIYSYYAINLIGGVVVPVNNFLKGTEVSYILSDCQVHTLITTASLARSVLPHRAELKHLKHIVLVGEVEEDLREISRPYSALMEAAPSANRERRSSPSDLAVIIYTSGTTGRPKGAMLSNRNLIYNANSSRSALDMFPQDRFVLFLPLFHSFTATVCMLLPIYLGCTIVLLESVNRKDIRHAITRYRITIFVAVPALNPLTALLDLAGGRDRALEAAGASLPFFAVSAIIGVLVSIVAGVASWVMLRAARKQGSTHGRGGAGQPD